MEGKVEMYDEAANLVHDEVAHCLFIRLQWVGGTWGLILDA